MRVPLDLRYAYRLINHGPTTLVTAQLNGQVQLMPVAWITPLRMVPPRLGIVLSKESTTRRAVESTGEFVINIPSGALLNATYALGKTSGQSVDKIKAHGLTTSAASQVSAPLIERCLGWLECKSVGDQDVQKQYDLFIADVVAAWADERSFHDGMWDFADETQRTIHHVARGVFYMPGEAVRALEPSGCELVPLQPALMGGDAKKKY